MSLRLVRTLVAAVVLAVLALAETAPAAAAEPTLQSRIRGALLTSGVPSSSTGALVLDLSPTGPNDGSSAARR